MKLYNQTEIPDEILTPVLALAAQAVGARYADVPVRAVKSRKYLSGYAKRSAWVKERWLQGKRQVYVGLNEYGGEDFSWGPEQVECDGGYILFRLPVGYILLGERRPGDGRAHL